MRDGRNGAHGLHALQHVRGEPEIDIVFAIIHHLAMVLDFVRYAPCEFKLYTLHFTLYTLCESLGIFIVQ